MIVKTTAVKTPIRFSFLKDNMQKLTRTLITINLIMLAINLLSYAGGKLIDLSLNQSFMWMFNLLWFIAACILLFLYLKENLTWAGFFIALLPLAVLIGIFVIVFVIFFPVKPPGTVYAEGGIRIDFASVPFGPCCPNDVFEIKAGLFQSRLGTIFIHPNADLSGITVSKSEEEVHIKGKKEIFGYATENTETDTTIVFHRR